jgi:hypothetical protein
MPMNYASLSNAVNKISGFTGARSLGAIAGYSARYAGGLLGKQPSLFGPRAIGGMAKNWITATDYAGKGMMRAGAVGARAALGAGAAGALGYGGYKAGEAAWNHPLASAAALGVGAAYKYRAPLGRAASTIPGIGKAMQSASDFKMRAMSRGSAAMSKFRAGSLGI